MAIFGVGSVWDEKEEVQPMFIAEGKFMIGWDLTDARDLHAMLASFKVGDILFIKSCQPGGRTIRVKGIGIVTKSLVDCIQEGKLGEADVPQWKKRFVEVAWITDTEFKITVPGSEGRTAPIRVQTIYEEFLPLVQREIIGKIIASAPSNRKK